MRCTLPWCNDFDGLGCQSWTAELMTAQVETGVWLLMAEKAGGSPYKWPALFQGLQLSAEITGRQAKTYFTPRAAFCCCGGGLLRIIDWRLVAVKDVTRRVLTADTHGFGFGSSLACPCMARSLKFRVGSISLDRIPVTVPEVFWCVGLATSSGSSALARAGATASVSA